MKKNAKILKFNVNKLKTMKELQGAQIALLQDITSGAVTVAESRPIYKGLNALVKRWYELMKEASTPSGHPRA